MALSETNGESTFGLGLGASVQVGFKVSTAANPHDLVVPFTQLSATIAVGEGISGDVFWGQDNAGQLVICANINWVLAGAATSVSQWFTYTWVLDKQLGYVPSFLAEAIFKGIYWPSYTQQTKAINVANQMYQLNMLISGLGVTL